MIDLNGRTSLITGGPRGIGRAAALAPAAAGIHVVVTGRRDRDGPAQRSRFAESESAVASEPSLRPASSLRRRVPAWF